MTVTSTIVRAATALALCLFLAATMSIARRSSQTLPVSDEAVIELSTLNALQGRQLLGPYSRYAWHHPGPALFYLLAPFYGASGRRAAGLAAGALALNVAVLAIGLWILYRRGGGALALAFAIASAVYLASMEDLLVSSWNAHAAVLAAASVLVCGAAVASGWLALLPLFVLLASFAVQTHIATLPLAAVASIGVAAGLARRRPRVDGRHAGAAVRDADADRRRLRGALVAALASMLVLWVLPVVEQMRPGRGNIGSLIRFAIEPSGSAAPAVALEAWADMLTAPLRGAAALPLGGLMVHDGVGWVGLAAAAEIVLLAAVAWQARRQGRSFTAWLAALLASASVAGLWAATRIPDGIHDHELFWLSAVGALNLAAIGAAPFGRWGTAGPVRLAAAAVAALVLAGVTSGGVRALVRLSDRSHVATRGDARLERATRAVEEEIARTGSRRPKILIDQRVWESAAGVILQLRKKGALVAVEPGLERMFSGTVAADGTEDLEITFCGGPCHERLASRPGNTVVLFGDGLAIDALRLAPPLRP